MSKAVARLVLYHREGCHLCDDMLDRLQDLRVDWKFELEVLDVDEVPGLFDLYNDKVPVLSLNGSEICRYHLDEAALLECLKSAAVAIA